MPGDPDYEYWNRTPKDFEDIEVAFFEGHDIPTPERVIQLLTIKPQEASDAGTKLNTAFLLKPGCYLIFDTYENLSPMKVIPLYVGKANNLERRLREHWGSRENFVDEYLESISEEDPELMQSDATEVDVPDYKKLPVGFIRFTYWFEEDDKERMYLEHELIYKCRPVYNRA